MNSKKPLYDEGFRYGDFCSNNDRGSVDITHHSCKNTSYEKEVSSLPKNINECHNALPEPSQWPDKPIFIQPVKGTKLIGQPNNEDSSSQKIIRLGVPTPFETPLFRGKCLFRLKSVKSINQIAQEQYFSHPNNTKKVIQIAIQGQFKESLHMSEVYTMEEFDKPLPRAPPKIFGKLLQKIFNAIVPGLVLDIYADNPKILCRIGGGCHTMSIDAPGNEPDLCSSELPERTMHSCDLRSSSKRKKILSRDSRSDPGNMFHPDLVYTFNNSDDFLDLGNYNVNFPLVTMNLTKFLGGQPLGMTVATNKRTVYAFKIWHERLIAEEQDCAKRSCK